MFGNWKLVIGICLVIASWLLVMVPAGAVPQTINFQGILKDSAGKPINGTVNLTFSIYDSVSGGTARWSEVQNGVTVEAGIYSVQLGSVNPIDYSIFDGSTKYLGVKVGDEELTPRLPMISVPYAFRAASAEVATNANYATLSGTASSAATVNNIPASTTPTANALLALDGNKQLKTSISAEAQGNPFALFVNGKIGVAGACYGSGTIISGNTDDTKVDSNSLTASSIVFVSLGVKAGYDPGNWYVYRTANDRFTVKVTNAPSSNLTYYYLIINN